MSGQRQHSAATAFNVPEINRQNHTVFLQPDDDGALAFDPGVGLAFRAVHAASRGNIVQISRLAKPICYFLHFFSNGSSKKCCGAESKGSAENLRRFAASRCQCRRLRDPSPKIGLFGDGCIEVVHAMTRRAHCVRMVSADGINDGDGRLRRERGRDSFLLR